MGYFLNLFTPETWAAFRDHGAVVSGFRYRQRRVARENVRPGDIFLCYLVRLSRWCGALKVASEAYEDDTPLFSNPDPFVIRFKVQPIAVLDLQYSIPIFQDEIWNTLTETKGIAKGAQGWAAAYRGSLRRMAEADGDLLLKKLRTQATERAFFALTERDERQLGRKRTVKTVEGDVTVSVPEPDAEEEKAPLSQDDLLAPELRRSLTVQATLAKIGIAMGFRIWLPKADKKQISELIGEDNQNALLDHLPLNYDDATLDTISQIDVLWLKGRSITRAFEVEHTTAVYSGLLRMADLLALQPNMDIKLHIVAPEERRDKVFREMLRPVFSLLDRGPLSRSCTFISYASVDRIAELEHLAYLRDGILEEYEEEAEV